MPLMKTPEERAAMPAGRVPLPAAALATWFGCGLAPVAPGTVASAVAVAIVWLLAHYTGAGAWHVAALAVLSFFVGVWASTVAAEKAGRKDPGFVVIDEVSGQWFTLAACPSFSWQYLLAGFLLFRAFDIFKPPPVRQAERLPRGWGIMADDGAAGLLGALVLAVAGWFNL